MLVRQKLVTEVVEGKNVLEMDYVKFCRIH